MSARRRSRPNLRPASASTKTSLEQVLQALEAHKGLSPGRRRDLRSAVNRVATLLGEGPRNIVVDVTAISAKLAQINPIAARLSPKSFSNVRSAFLAALKACGLVLMKRPTKQALTPGWADLMSRASAPRVRIGLSRLARFASANGIDPSAIDDAAIVLFMSAVRQGSLHRNPNALHRSVTLIWNEVARRIGGDLTPVTVPSFRGPAKRIAWQRLPQCFRDDVESYLVWCGGADPFDANARPRTLSPRTIKLRRDQIHAAVTALIGSGINCESITSLGTLIAPEPLKRILRRRLESEGGRENSFNRDLGEALVQIAREWLKVDPETLTELKRIVGKMPMPASGLTDKNKRFLRQFDDPAVLRRLLLLPDLLWAEVERDRKPTFWTLAKAQAALAVAILTYMPIRLQNLAALAFDTHLFLRDAPRAISSLELNASEVKNRRELAFDIPLPVAKMLIEYREKIAPRIIGHRPQRLFVNADGTAKSQATVAWLIASYLKRRAGIVLTAHQFRHLSAKLALDAEPGGYETVKQFLGHRNLKTTVGFYAGIDSRRAARHHQKLIDETLRQQGLPKRRMRPSK